MSKANYTNIFGTRDFGTPVAHIETHVAKNHQSAPPPVLHPASPVVPSTLEGGSPSPGDSRDYDDHHGAMRYARVERIESGGSGNARVK